MAELTEARVRQMGDELRTIVENMNALKIGEIRTLLGIMRHNETMMPFTDPTRYQHEYNSMRQTRVVLENLITFKTAVSGIGDFEKIDE